MKIETKHCCSRIRRRELAKRKQRSQVEPSGSNSKSRPPSHDGRYQVWAETKDRASKSICGALACSRKLNRGTISEACRDRKLNYGNKLPLQTTTGLSVDCTFDARSHLPLLASRRQLKLGRFKGLTESKPSFCAAFQYLLVVGAILALNHGVPVGSKSIDDSPSQRVNLDKNFLATLKPFVQSTQPEGLRLEPFEGDSTTTSSSFEANGLRSAAAAAAETETTTTITTTDQDDTSSQNDDNDAEGCQGISVGDAAEAKNYTDNERLVNLQTCIQRKIERRLNGAKRFGLEMFEKLSISGGCSSSIMSLASSLNQIKSFAFKCELS